MCDVICFFPSEHDIPVLDPIPRGGEKSAMNRRYIYRSSKRREREEDVPLRRTTLPRSPGVTLSHSWCYSRERTVSDETVCGSERTGNALTEHYRLEGQVVNG